MAERSEAVEQPAVRDASAVYSVETEVATSEDVPPGYKRTEVGMIPQDWEVEHLSELGSTYAGLTYKPSNVRSFGRLVLRASNIKEGKLVFNSDDVFVDAVIPQRAIVREGDILICVRNGSARLIGKSARIPKSAEGHAFGAFMTVFRANDDGFTFYLFQSDIVQRQIKERMGATINQITGKDLSEFLVPVPTAAREQRAIATALSDADALIESLDRLIAKKRAIKQAAMQQLLTGQTRLPGFTSEWETKRLGELGTTYGGLVGKTKKDFGVGTGRYITFLNIVSNTVIDCSAFEAVSVGPLENQHKVAKGDLFFNGSSETPEEVGMCAVLNEEVGSVFLNSFCFGFRLQDNVPANPLYLAYYFRSQEGREILKMLAQGATRYNLSKTALMDVVFPVPEVDEQIAIATVLSDMDTEIEALEHRRDKARQTKQGMMQQLLTGRVRLVNSAGRNLSNRKPRSGQRKANVHFMRSVFAAEIVDQLHQEPTFGHVKMQKVLFLAEHLCDVDIGSTYHRKAAGPYDNRALRSIDSQMKKQQWFEARKEGERYRYVPLEKRGNHKAYFDRYFHHVSKLFRSTVETFRKLDTERCEIVATLYSAWDDLLCDQTTVSDEMIIHEVQNNWHESKKRIPEDRWSRALQWMRENGFVPKRRLPNEQ